MSTDTVATDAAVKRQAFIAGLREFADWIEQRAAVPIPPSYADIPALTVNTFVGSDELPTLARAMGYVEKAADDDYFILRRSFGPISYDINSYRDEVCERVVVGTRTVERDKVEVVGTETVELEIVEWRCPDSLLANHEATGADASSTPAEPQPEAQAGGPST